MGWLVPYISLQRELPAGIVKVILHIIDEETHAAGTNH